MPAPALTDLPSPPAGRSGWPWTAPAAILPATLPDGSPWPRVSIVTPSFNQGPFIEETIRSVLLQGYPDLEYIVIDGGSTDGTVEILAKYEPWLAFWVSEPDRGQAHAINKGFRRATGEIVAWLNSDDLYLPEALRTAVEAMHARGADALYGNCYFLSAAGARRTLIVPPPVTYETLLRFWRTPGSTPPQPAIFLRRRVLDEVGLLDETLRYTMDYELWLRVAARHQFSYLDTALAGYRLHPASKTGIDDFRPERYRVSYRYGARQGWSFRLAFAASYARYRLVVWRSRLWQVVRRWTWLERQVLRAVGPRRDGWRDMMTT